MRFPRSTQGLLVAMPVFWARVFIHSSCLLNLLLSGGRPLSFSAYHFQPSPSLISFLLLLLPGIEQRSRISPPKKEGEGGREGEEESSRGHLPLLLPPSCLSGGSPPHRCCQSVVDGDGVGGERGRGGNGEDDQSIFVVVIASGLASLSLSLSPPLSLTVEGGKGKGERQKSRQEEMEKNV